MAWNKYYVFVQSNHLPDMGEILVKLNLTDYKPVRQVPLTYSDSPRTLFTGVFNGSLLIVHQDLPFHFFDDTPSEAERLFVETFPNSEIAALIESSRSGLFSYAIIQNGRRIRMKDGADGEIYHDEGELLAEEKELLAETIFEAEELAEMKAEGMSEEEIASQIGFETSFRVPNRLTKRYLGQTVDTIEAHKVMLTMYQ